MLEKHTFTSCLHIAGPGDIRPSAEVKARRQERRQERKARRQKQVDNAPDVASAPARSARIAGVPRSQSFELITTSTTACLHTYMCTRMAIIIARCY